VNRFAQRCAHSGKRDSKSPDGLVLPNPGLWLAPEAAAVEAHPELAIRDVDGYLQRVGYEVLVLAKMDKKA
jgi:hypothetical protein